jgi:hypothetical protein
MTLDKLMRAITELPPSEQARFGARFGAWFAAFLAARAAGTYTPTPEEQAGIDRGLRDVKEGNLASEAEVEATFAKHRQP